MDIREALLAEHSKHQTMKIVRYIGDNPKRFAELMSHFLGPIYRLSQRAAWAVNYCAEHRPELIKPYFGRLVEQLDRDDVHDAVRRNVIRSLQFIEIPKRYHGRVFDACFNLVDDPHQPVAIRVFAMSVAARIAKNKPALLNELRLLVEKHLPHATAGFRARARNMFSDK
ncbi:MAG: hypothetical protein ACRD6X_10440 [Pyrinomonadaceae bacterium]